MWGLLERIRNRVGESETAPASPEPATASERAVKAPLSEIEEPDSDS
jgi:hypothetical protein